MKKYIITLNENDFGFDDLMSYFSAKGITCIEQPQGELTNDEKRLIGEAVEYLLGANLVEENGWSKKDIEILQSLSERYYDKWNLSEGEENGK